MLTLRNACMSATLLAATAASALAASVVGWPPQNPTALWIAGEIKRGDEREVLASLRQAEGRIGQIYLNSPGGDVATSIAIGRIVRQYSLTTSAPVSMGGSVSESDRHILPLYPAPASLPPVLAREAVKIRRPEDVVLWSEGDPIESFRAQCASACAIVWVAGVARTGNAVGLHRPHFDPSWFAGLSAEQAARQYDSLLAEVRTYLEQMGVPTELIRLIENIASYELRYDEAFIDRLEGDIPAMAEWLIAKCGPDIYLVWNTLEAEFAKPTQEVFDRMERGLSCRETAMAEARRDAYRKANGK